MAREHKDHSTARAIIKGAVTRWNGVEREQHDGDAQLIVMGAVLEEVGVQGDAIDELTGAIADLVEALADRPSGGISINIGGKQIAVLLGILGALGGGSWWVAGPPL
jgi:hypothetical protein